MVHHHHTTIVTVIILGTEQLPRPAIIVILLVIVYLFGVRLVSNAHTAYIALRQRIPLMNATGIPHQHQNWIRSSSECECFYLFKYTFYDDGFVYFLQMEQLQRISDVFCPAASAG